METCSNCHNAPEMCNCLDKPGDPPEFRQEFMGNFVAPEPPAKVGDIAYNHRTGHSSRVKEAHTRSDGRIYAILESGAKCVLPSPNWEYRENAGSDARRAGLPDQQDG